MVISLGRWLRGLAWLLAGLVALPLLLFALWVPFNMIDAPARPVPAALQLPAPALAESENMAYAIEGLRAPEGSDAAVWGRQQWEEQNRRAAMGFAQQVEAARAAASAPAREPTILAVPAGPPWVCTTGHDDCTTTWLAQRDALAAQRQAHALFGRRCEALLATELRYEELRATQISVRSPLPQFAGTVTCMRWFHTGALLAWARGDAPSALADMRRADRLLRAQLAGSHSLVAHMIARRMAQHQLQAITALAVRDAALVPQLAPFLADWPDPRAAMRRWMAFEYGFGEAALREADAVRCAESPGEDSATPGAHTAPATVIYASRTERFLQCHLGIGLQVEHAIQLHQDAWLRRIDRIGAAPFHWPTLLEQQRAETAAHAERPWWSLITWRNSIGHILVNVAAPAYDGYMARHADTELHRALVQLALAAQAQGISRTERAAWFARQPLPEVAAGRLTVSDDGRTISARSWQDEVPSASARNRNRIAITWPD